MNKLQGRTWFLPKRDRRWLIALPVTAGGIWSVIAGAARVLLGLSISGADALVWTGLSLTAAAAICGLGYAGLRAASVCSALGTAAGLAYMAYVFAQPIAYRGIIGLVSGAQVVLLFFLAGVNVQMICYLMRKNRRKVK